MRPELVHSLPASNDLVNGFGVLGADFHVVIVTKKGLSCILGSPLCALATPSKMTRAVAFWNRPTWLKRAYTQFHHLATLSRAPLGVQTPIPIFW